MINQAREVYNSQDFIALEKRFGASNYLPLPVVLSRGEGVWLWDVAGKKYLDMMSAYSAVSHGHCHPRLLKVLKEQSEQLCVTSRAYYTDALGPLLEELCSITGLSKALPMNTGAEAVETAIKAVRRWGYQVKGIPENKAEVIVFGGNFHGRTTTIISFSSEEEYKENFGPFSAGFKEVPFGDIDALRQAITPNTCAVLAEPMQGETGIRIPPNGWLKSLEVACRENNVLLISDEVQTGLGRTGKWFGVDHEGVKPDGIIVGKALGGGILPVSAFVGSNDLMSVFNPGSHGSTFGGNPLACRVALEGLRILQEDNLVERSAALGDYLIGQLRRISSPLIQDVRGKGLWVGVEIDPNCASARLVCEQLAERGILSKETHETVVRFAPPLVSTKEQIDFAITQFFEVLKGLE
jgi:ornithine--oxo-acid transaminase